ncbi:MAG: threonine ammonia-lyase, biosynthetic [Nevskiales bacterium]
MGTYRKRIESASVYDVAIQSPLEAAPQLSERLGNTVLLKREDLQPVHSFKLRGAYNKVAKLSAKQRVRGVICASAGNHAQGLALAASRAGIKSLIVMPRTTPSIKVEAVKRFGSRILLHGDTYDEAYEEARRQAAERGMSFVHPYDDPDVIAGQGTVGMEILRQHPGKLDAVFVPVGGGGFIAGVAAYIKAVRPKVKVIGVEPEDAACLQAALKTGKRVVLDQIGLFADGVAVRQAGAEPFKLARRYVDEVVTASVDEICAATRDIFEENRSLPEPAGALALAGLKNHVAAKKWSGKTLVAIESGSNVNFDRLRHIAERAEIGEHREALLAVTIPERPGSFRQFCADLGKRGITEFNYRYADRQAAHIFVGVRLQDGVNEKDELVAQLRASDYAVADLTDNEMAKVHVRYMVGGRASGVDNEILFRFEFPERPGALLQFLNQIGSRWNISLFHYRNHGAAYGRVLVGMQVPSKELRECRRRLDEIGYEYAEESDNRAYDLFLGSA